MIILGIIFAALNVAVIWSIFVIKAHIEKQTTIQVTQMRLLAKVAKASGCDTIEIDKLLSDTASKL